MPTTFDLTRFALAVQTKRGAKNLRATSAEIGAISPATLLRIEAGTITPNMPTILRVCTWLHRPLSDFLLPSPEKEEAR